MAGGKLETSLPDSSPDKTSSAPGLPLHIHAEEDLAVSFDVLKGHTNGKEVFRSHSVK